MNEDPVRYARPDQVFWADHPFGRYRYRIGSGLRPFEELLTKLGVHSDPEIGDFIQVILDISNENGKNPIDEVALKVVMNCWRKLSDVLAAGNIDAKALQDKLADKKVIPDQGPKLPLDHGSA